MFTKTIDGLDVYKKEVNAFLEWLKDHKKNPFDITDFSEIDPEMIKNLWRARIEGMAQALGLKKKERKEINSRLGFEE